MSSDTISQLGMIGLGRMGGNLTRRLLHGGHRCVVYDVNDSVVRELEAEGADGASSLQDFTARLPRPRVIWMMLPALAVQSTVDRLAELLEPGDAIVDGGNSHYRDDISRAKQLASVGVQYVDCGTSGGVWGLDRGYCLMIGGDAEAVERLDPLFRSIAPGAAVAPPTPRRTTDGTAPQGYLHCGPHGAGHFVKMVHNGVEYGMMSALAEGLTIIRHADVGNAERLVNAETAPVRDPEAYRYTIDIAEVAEVWRRGSVISSWLVDLTADALAGRPQLDGLASRVSDSGEGRWTVAAAVDEAVPAPVITAALIERFASRGLGGFTGELLSAMRGQFGGHPGPR